jgi:hypothetical protein
LATFAERIRQRSQVIILKASRVSRRLTFNCGD